MPFRLKIFHKGLILVGTPLLLNLVLIAGLFFLLQQSEAEKTKEIRYRHGAVVTAHLVALTAEAPLLIIGAIEYDSERFFKGYKRALASIEQNTREIDRIRLECPEIKVPFKEDLQRQQSGILAVTAKFAALRDKTGAGERVANILSMSRELKEATKTATEDLSQLTRHGEVETAKTRQNQERINREQNLLLAAGALGNLIIGIVLAVFYRQAILQRIMTITNNTIALSRGEPLIARLKGFDETALVDHSFHAMHEELLAASERERALFENAIDVICVLNESNEITSINPICEQHWGYTPSQLVGVSIKTLINTLDLDAMLSRIGKTRSSGEAMLFECRINARSGQLKEALWSAYWSDSEQSLFCTVHDLTEQNQIERARAQFLSLISANLSLPLNSIAQALKRLIDPQTSNLSEQAIAKLCQISKNMTRLVGLVHDLLHVNQMEFVHIKICKDYGNIADVVQRSLEEVSPLALEKNIEIQVEAAPGQWQVDRDRLIQVLVNLLTNAIKFSQPDSLIRVSTEKNADCVYCRVTDQGRGVPESLQQDIFERFKQADLKDSLRKSGTGLGLPICKRIIEEHQGQIGVKSAEGKGSTFWFRIPVDEKAAERQKIAEATLKTNVSAAPAATARDVKQDKAQGGKQDKIQTSASAGHIRTRLGLTGKGVLLVGIPVVCQFALIACLAHVLIQVDHERAFELKERLVSNYANAFMISCIDAVAKMGHSYSEADWLKIQADMESAHKSRDKLNRLAKDDRREMEYAGKAEQSFKALDSAYALSKESVQKGNELFLSYPDRHATLLPLLKMFYSLDKVIEMAEARELESPFKQESLRRNQANVLAFGLAANIISAFLLATYFSKDINSRLLLLADNANRLAKNKELNPLQAGYDEIAKLDQIFHVMASALAEAIKKERAFLDNSQDIICVIDSTGKFLSINPVCEKMWGYASETVLQEKTVLDITHADDRERTEKTFFTDADNQTRFQFENRIISRTGGIIHTLWSCSRKPGEPLLYCLAHDISARKQLEQMKQEFLTMVSHDLRSPLTAIVGMTQLVSAEAFGTVAPEDRQILQQVNKDCRSLVELTSDLLDLEKLEAGKMPLIKQETELADVLNKAIAACPAKAGIKLEYTSELDETVLTADFERLTQAFTNIINFAASNSKAQVRIRLKNTDGWSRVQIIDSGPVLCQTDCLELFQRYGSSANERVEAERVNSSLSLTLAHAIIKSHQGTVSVTGQESGNLFTVSLPRRDTD